jgi:hypothetical protein
LKQPLAKVESNYITTFVPTFGKEFGSTFAKGCFKEFCVTFLKVIV